jgi:hypothetical protein
MFCPECQAEYRTSFTRFSDCYVALVERLEETDVHSQNPEHSGTPELLWTGTDTMTRDGIVAMRENLITCLRNIGIGSATGDSAGQLRIRVTPSSQKRAEEMIRQINEATEGQ